MILDSPDMVIKVNFDYLGEISYTIDPEVTLSIADLLNVIFLDKFENEDLSSISKLYKPEELTSLATTLKLTDF